MLCFTSKLSNIVSLLFLLLSPCIAFGDLVMTVTEVGPDLHFNHSGATIDTSALTIGGGLSSGVVVWASTNNGAWSGGPEILRNWQGAVTNTVSSGWTENGAIRTSWDNSPTGHGFLVSSVFDVFYLHDVTLSAPATSVTLDPFHGILLNTGFSDFGWTEGESITSSWATDSVTFQIGAISIPEPNAAILICTCFAGLLRRCKRNDTLPLPNNGR